MPASPRTCAEAGRVIQETTGVDPRLVPLPVRGGCRRPAGPGGASGPPATGTSAGTSGVEDWDPANSAATIEREVIERTLGARRRRGGPAPHLADGDAWSDPGHRRPPARCRARRSSRIDALGEVPRTVDVSPARAAGRSRSWPSMAATRRPTCSSSDRTAGCWRPAADRRPRTSRSGWTPARTGSSTRRTPRGPGRASVRPTSGRPRSGSYALAGADTPADVRRLRAAFAARRLASSDRHRQRRVRADPGRLRARLGDRRHLRLGRQRGGDRARTGGRPGSPRSATISGDWGGGGDARHGRARRRGPGTRRPRPADGAGDGSCPAPLRAAPARST